MKRALWWLAGLCFLVVGNIYGQQRPYPDYDQGVYFTWRYGVQDWTVMIKLNEKVYQQYLERPRPAKFRLEHYYQQLISPQAGDMAIKDLAAEFRKLAKRWKLKESVLTEMAIAFVQQLPYSDEQGAQALADYPYVTLWRGSGTCLDKGLLAVALLKELGVGCSLLYFDAVPLPTGGFDEHVALGLACDTRAYWQGFCYVEVAESAYIGWVPKITGQILEADERCFADKANQHNADNLGPAKVLLASNGKKYIP